jgi:hypothetical protein
MIGVESDKRCKDRCHGLGPNENVEEAVVVFILVVFKEGVMHRCPLEHHFQLILEPYSNRVVNSNHGVEVMLALHCEHIRFKVSNI